MQISITMLIFCFLTTFASSTPSQILSTTLQTLINKSSLMGIQYQITNKTHTLYNGNFGFKDGIKPIQNSTVFRVASLSKSVTAAAIMLLVQSGKIKLNQSLSSLLGFEVKNPYFPETDITVQMILSHQSSLIECQPYYTNFLMDSSRAKTGLQVPLISDILTPGKKYYNQCLFSNKSKPGTYFEYVNLNFGIAGAIIEKISGVRFDIFVQQNILKYISQDLPEIATFNIATIKNSENLGTCYESNDGKWDPAVDYYPDGKIPSKNLTDYKIGSNGVIFGPQGGMRASATHLSNYIRALANGGVTKNGKRILSQKSVSELLKPRYQFHGLSHGAEIDFHLYGFGIFTSSYRTSDQVIQHETVRGHIGDAYGLISAYYFWGNYTMTYIVNGALYGYEQDKKSIFEKERQILNEAASSFIKSL